MFTIKTDFWFQGAYIPLEVFFELDHVPSPYSTWADIEVQAENLEPSVVEIALDEGAKEDYCLECWKDMETIFDLFYDDLLEEVRLSTDIYNKMQAYFEE